MLEQVLQQFLLVLEDQAAAKLEQFKGVSKTLKVPVASALLQGITASDHGPAIADGGHH